MRACSLLLQCASFLHMHLGIDATGLPSDLDCHHLVVNDWSNLEAPLNVCIASIPTVFDADLAPPGKAVVHTYTAGNEPYSVWEGLRRGSREYEDLKQQRAQTLWQVRAQHDAQMQSTLLWKLILWVPGDLTQQRAQTLWKVTAQL